MGQLNRAAETLVLLRVIVLETDLKLNSLSELALLLPGLPDNQGNGLLDRIT
jgi:hypothetical protein